MLISSFGLNYHSIFKFHQAYFIIFIVSLSTGAESNPSCGADAERAGRHAAAGARASQRVWPQCDVCRARRAFAFSACAAATAVL